MHSIPPTIQEELERLQLVAITGNFFDSSEELNTLLERKEISFEEKLKVKLFQSELIGGLTSIELDEYTYEDGLKLAEEVVENIGEIEDKYLKVDSLLMLGYSHFYLNNWQKTMEMFERYSPLFNELEPTNNIFYIRLKAKNYIYESMIPFLQTYVGKIATEEEKIKGFQLIQEGEKFCEKNNLKVYQISCLNNISTIQYWLGDLEGSLKTKLKLVETAKSVGNKLYYAFTLNILAEAYSSMNDYKKSYDLHKERLVIVEELGIKSMIAKSYRNIGSYSLTIGDFDEALDYYYRSLKIYQDLENIIGVAFTQQYCGYAFFLKGNFEKALEYYDQAFPVLEEKKPQSWRIILSDIASILMQIGELDKALEYLEKLMTINKGLQDQHGISLVLSEQGKIYWQKGMKEQGLDLIERSLEIRRKIGDKAREAASLSYLIQFNIELNNVEVAKKYFKDLDLINKEISNIHVNQYHKFSEALILKTSANNRDRIKAELLFEQLIEEEASYPVLVQVLLHLCELLLVDMRKTSNTDLLEKINKYVDMLQDLSDKNNSHILLVETLGLRAQLSLLEFDVETARSILLKAQTIAQENGLDGFVLDLLKQQEDLTKQSIKLRELEQTQSPISSRMSVVKLEDTVVNIQKASLAKTVSREEVSKKLLSIQI